MDSLCGNSNSEDEVRYMEALENVCAEQFGGDGDSGACFSGVESTTISFSQIAVIKRSSRWGSRLSYYDIKCLRKAGYLTRQSQTKWALSVWEVWAQEHSICFIDCDVFNDYF